LTLSLKVSDIFVGIVCTVTPAGGSALTSVALANASDWHIVTIATVVGSNERNIEAAPNSFGADLILRDQCGKGQIAWNSSAEVG